MLDLPTVGVFAAACRRPEAVGARLVKRFFTPVAVIAALVLQLG